MDKTKKSFKSAILALVFALILLPCAIFLVGCDEEKKQPTLTLLSSFKTVYAVDEELDVTGGKLLYTDENGKSGTVYITASLVTGFDSSVPGTREMIVTYKDLSVEVTYTVKEEPKASIEIGTTFKTEYVLNEELNLTGGSLVYTSIEGQETVVDLTEELVYGFDSSTKGQKELIVNYEGLTLKVPYTVSNFAFGEYTAYVQRTIYNEDGRIEDLQMESTSTYIIFNEDLTGLFYNGNEENAFTYNFDVDGNVTFNTPVQLQEMTCQYSDNEIIMLASTADEYKTYLIFSEINKMEKNVVYAYSEYNFIILNENSTIGLYDMMEGVEDAGAILYEIKEEYIKDSKYVIRAELIEKPSYTEQYVNIIEITVIDSNSLYLKLIDVSGEEMGTITLTKMA